MGSSQKQNRISPANYRISYLAFCRNCTAKVIFSSQFSSNALVSAIRGGALDVVKIILERNYESFDTLYSGDVKKEGIDRVDVFRNTLLHVAAIKVLYPLLL